LRKLSASYKIDSLRLGISIAFPLIAGVIGSIFTSQSVSTWFQTIEKPSFSPPNWLFGPVWTTLYVLMGISLFLIWRATTTFPDYSRSRKIAAFTAFGTQLILNVSYGHSFSLV
jgi:tryptophan-rich sensory protein